jgi:hypothetical protein
LHLAVRPLGIGCLLLCFLLTATRSAAGPKTDTVRLDTGDILTGEIKSLERGQLTYSTDTMETVSIKWARVLRISSPSWYLVTVEGGAQHYGRLQAADSDGKPPVAILNRYEDLEMVDVVRILPIENKLWDRISVALSFGLSYTQASDVSQLTFDASFGYKDRATRPSSAGIPSGPTRGMGRSAASSSTRPCNTSTRSRAASSARASSPANGTTSSDSNCACWGAWGLVTG